MNNSQKEEQWQLSGDWAVLYDTRTNAREMDFDIDGNISDRLRLVVYLNYLEAQLAEKDATIAALQADNAQWYADKTLAIERAEQAEAALAEANADAERLYEDIIATEIEYGDATEAEYENNKAGADYVSPGPMTRERAIEMHESAKLHQQRLGEAGKPLST